MLSVSDLVARYLRFREISKKLNSVLVSMLATDVLNEGGRELGLLRKGVFVFNNEDETSVLMDYCIYNVYRQGRNMIQGLLADNPPPEGSEESLLVQGMARAWYSVFTITRIEPGTGVYVQDILRQTEHLLLDIGYSRSGVPGAMFASRVIPLDGFLMTAGAGLPLGGDMAQRDQLIGRMSKVFFAHNITSFEHLSPQQEKELAQAIISTALSWGASSQISYQDPDKQDDHPGQGYSQRRGLVPVRTGARVGRNERCPCGSGKKFKKCCAAGR